MSEAQKSFKEKLKNDGLHVEEEAGTLILKDGKGRTIGGGGGGTSVIPSETETPGAKTAKSLSIDGVGWNMPSGGNGEVEITVNKGTGRTYTGSVTAEQKEILANGGVLKCVMTGTNPLTAATFTALSGKNNGELWGNTSYYGSQLVTVYVAASNQVVVDPMLIYDQQTVYDKLKEKQNVITSGTEEPTGGNDGDVYIQLGS